MEFTGKVAVALAEKYGLPIQKQTERNEGFRNDFPLKDAQWILDHGDPAAIFVDAEPDMAELMRED